MNKIFNLTSTFKTQEQDDGSVMIRGFASTADFDRAGDTISAEAWQKGGLKNFEKIQLFYLIMIMIDLLVEPLA